MTPLSSFRATRSENKKFFKNATAERIDVNQFSNTNYMTNYKAAVGVAKPMNPAYTNKFRKSPKSSILGGDLSRTMDTPNRKEHAYDRYKTVKKLLSNEKQAAIELKK